MSAGLRRQGCGDMPWAASSLLLPQALTYLSLSADSSLHPKDQHLVWAAGSCRMEAFEAGSLLSLKGPGL